VMATALELAGAGHPEHVQFDSLLDDIQDASPDITGQAYGAYVDVQRMITVGNMKLILYPKIRRRLLFDLQTDPLEMTDVSANAELLPLQHQLFAQLLLEQHRTGDKLELTESFPELTSSLTD